jgi:hypothetical protein
VTKPLDLGTDVQAAMAALADFAGARRYELTELEARMWLGFVERVDADKFKRFLGVWGLRSNFMPTLADAARALGVVATPEQSFEHVMRQVVLVGPYNTPELDANLRQAVTLMGGWARFCEEAPDASNEFAHTQFRKRFLELYGQAQAQVEIQGIEPPVIRGLADASRERLALGMNKPASLPAPSVETPPVPRG